MRQLLVWCGIGLAVAGCSGDGTGLGTPVTTVSVTPTASGNGQTGVVGTALPLPLRAVVDSAGIALVGTRVTWTTSGGTITPPDGLTDAAGIAAATWTLDRVAGPKSATASVAGLIPKANFQATARAGPLTSIKKLFGDSQTVGVNQGFLDLGVAIADQYGNSGVGRVTWTVAQGPVAFILPPGDLTDANGFSTASVGPVGTKGAALVRASLPGGAPAVNFVLTVGEARALVRLSSATFRSLQNNSRNPAVDTIPVGHTVVWTLDFDYEQHRVVSVGTPSFPTPGDFPYYAQIPTVSVTFTVPGTYRYTDFYNSAATGVIVVQ